MSDLVVETPEGLSLRFELAGAGSRSAAALLDLLLWGLALLAAVMFFQTVLGGLGGLALLVGAGAVVSLVSYHALFGVLGGGSTPGKHVMGLVVRDQSGLGATPLQHLLRSMFWPFEALLLVPVPLGVILMAATPRHQRLGDQVAGTLVLRRDRRPVPRDVLPRLRWSELPSHALDLVPAQAARFDAADLVFLRELLARAGTDYAARGRLLRRAARHYADRLGLAEDARPADGREAARAFLSELYLFLRELRGGS